MPWILVSLISEFGPELRAWAGTLREDTWLYSVIIYYVQMGFKLGLKQSPSVV